ncbi:restriction endonuclease [Streptacidiphilus rugosus]|uniref:restriction endonuclease n=1 Tax=Streptacidiphilus rugosus TaxID=405783 RepID=UPI002FBE5C39
MIRDGISTRHVGQRGDQAADAIGRDRWGRVYVAQCKHTTVGGRVGSSVMYQIKGTAGPVHGAAFGVLVTNGQVTRDARAWGDLNAVYWLDRERLRLWAEDGLSLQEVLHLQPGRRRVLG